MNLVGKDQIISLKVIIGLSLLNSHLFTPEDFPAPTEARRCTLIYMQRAGRGPGQPALYSQNLVHMHMHVASSHT